MKFNLCNFIKKARPNWWCIGMARRSQPQDMGHIQGFTVMWDIAKKGIWLKLEEFSFIVADLVIDISQYLNQEQFL